MWMRSADGNAQAAPQTSTQFRGAEMFARTVDDPSMTMMSGGGCRSMLAQAARLAQRPVKSEDQYRTNHRRSVSEEANAIRERLGTEFHQDKKSRKKRSTTVTMETNVMTATNPQMAGTEEATAADGPAERGDIWLWSRRSPYRSLPSCCQSWQYRVPRCQYRWLPLPQLEVPLV